MSILVRTAGLQTTVQAAPRRARRHLGIPASGAADALSHALVNRLVGNPWSAPVLEATLAGPSIEAEHDLLVAVAGGEAKLTVNGIAAACHRTLTLRGGDRLDLGPVTMGARLYVGVAGGVAGDRVLDSESTYLPAALGGFRGRALRAGDRLGANRFSGAGARLETPLEFRPEYTGSYVLRVCPGAESHLLDAASRHRLLAENWRVGRRADRMGLELDGPVLAVNSDGRMPSAPVFPGTVQCPESGKPFLLGVDAQTTGGYPRVLQVVRADRHLIGQLRPGDHVRFALRRPDEATAVLREKHAFLRRWLPDVARTI